VTQFVILTTCKHRFCRLCCVSMLEQSIAVARFPVSCPTVTPSKCQHTFVYEDAKSAFGDNLRLLGKFETLDVAARFAQDSISCSNLQCKTLFQFVPGRPEFPQANLAQCPMCKFETCASCRCQWHRGMTCAQYQVRVVGVDTGNDVITSDRRCLLRRNTKTMHHC
jgi:hypothetical protein